MARNPDKKRCTAQTGAGGRCRNWAMRGHTLCRAHADPGPLPEPGERRCTAQTNAGEQCRQWAMRGQSLCRNHANPTRLPEPGERRCTAQTSAGEPCRKWAMRGHTLCKAHAEGSQVPEPEERRCTALTKSGERCPRWAIRGTEAQYGRLLCRMHVPPGDPRKSTTRMPAEGERRCQATTREGTQCRRWAIVEDEEGREEAQKRVQRELERVDRARDLTVGRDIRIEIDRRYKVGSKLQVHYTPAS